MLTPCFLVLLFLTNVIPRKIIEEQIFGQCVELKINDQGKYTNNFDKYVLQFEASEIFIFAVWFKIQPIMFSAAGLSQSQLDNDNTTIIQYFYTIYSQTDNFILQSYFDIKKKKHIFFCNTCTLDDAAIESIQIDSPYTQDSNQYWKLSLFEYNNQKLFFQDYIPQMEVSSYYAPLNLNSILKINSPIGNFKVKLAQAYQIMKELGPEKINIGFSFCGSFSLIGYLPGRLLSSYSLDLRQLYFYNNIDRILDLQFDLPITSEMDNQIHLIDQSNFDRNVTYYYRSKNPYQVNVKGGIPLSKSPLGTLQLTFSFWVKGQGSLFKVIRTHHRILGAFINPYNEVYVCYDESPQSPCFNIYKLQQTLNYWKHIILQFYEYSQDQYLRARYNIYENGIYIKEVSVSFKNPFVQQNSDTFTIGDKDIEFKDFRMWNGIEVTKGLVNCILNIVENNVEKCLLCQDGFFLLEGQCLNACPSAKIYKQEQRTCIRICSWKCSACDDQQRCTVCNGNRENPPYCECPEGTFFNDYLPNCKYKQQNSQIDYGVIKMNQDAPDQILKYACDEKIRCDGFGEKTLYIIKSFSKIFRKQPLLVTGLTSIKFTGREMDFMIQTIYTTQSQFKLQITVEKQAQLADLIINWLAFVEDDEEARSFLVSSVQYMFNSNIQEAVNNKNGVHTFDLPLSSEFKTTNIDNKEFLFFLNGMEDVKKNVYDDSLTSLDLKMAFSTKQIDNNLRVQVDIGTHFIFNMIKFTILMVDTNVTSVYKSDLALKMSTSWLHFYGISDFYFSLRLIEPFKNDIYISPLSFTLQDTPNLLDNSRSQLFPYSGTSYFTEIKQLSINGINSIIECSKIIDATCKHCSPSTQSCYSCKDKYAKPPTCTSCIAGAFRLQEKKICTICNPRCILCSSATYCTQCKSDFSPIPQCNQCLKANYYDDLDPTEPTCRKCHKTCSGCIQSATTCISCKISTGLILGVNNQCTECLQDSYFYNEIQNTCKKCDFRCEKCADSKILCLICTENRIRPPFCQCDVGYYETYVDEYTGPECSPCHPTCYTCTNYLPTSCIACNPKTNRQLVANISELHDQRSCDCLPRYFFKPEYGEQFNPDFYTCLSCHYTCWKCDGVKHDECIECNSEDDFRVLEDKQCLCKEGYFQNPAGYCQACYPDCKRCVNDMINSCIECYHNRTFSPEDMIIKFSASGFLFRPQEEQTGPCIKQCPGPDWWGEPTSGTCRSKYCGARYNPQKRECCYFPEEPNCLPAIKWSVRKDEYNVSRIFVDFTSIMALKENWQEYLIQNVIFTFKLLEVKQDFTLKIDCQDLKPLKELTNETVPAETRKNMAWTGSLFTFNIYYSNPITYSEVNVTLNQQEIRDPYGIAVKTQPNKDNELYKLSRFEVEQPDDITVGNSQNKAFYFINLGLAWLLFILIFLALQHYLYPILDLFQETYLLGFMIIELPIRITDVLRAFEPYNFQIGLPKLNHYRGRFWMELFGYTAEFEDIFGNKVDTFLYYIQGKPIQENALIHQLSGKYAKRSLFLYINGLFKKHYRRNAFLSNLQEEIFLSQSEEVNYYNSYYFSGLLKLEAYFYCLVGTYFYCMFSYIMMCSFATYNAIDKVESNNVFEYFVSTMFLVYSLIVWIRYIGDINYPNRLMKVDYYLRSYYSPMNDLKRLSSYLTLNICNVAMMRKFLVNLVLFFINDGKHAPLQAALIICIYLFETIYHIAILLQQRKPNSPDIAFTSRIQTKLYLVFAILKMLFVILLSTLCAQEVKIHNSINAKNFISIGLVTDKQNQGRHFGMIIAILAISFGIIGMCILIPLMNNFVKPLVYMRAKHGQKKFEALSQYDQHQNLMNQIINFRNKKPTQLSILDSHRFSNYCDQTYLVMPINFLYQFLKPAGGIIDIEMYNYRQRKRKFSSKRYQLLDIFSYKNFIIMVNNLQQESYKQQTYSVCVWIYHPSYQQNYMEEEEELSIKDLDIMDSEIEKEIQQLKEAVRKKENLNFASVSQIQYLFQQNAQLIDCQEKIGSNMPDILYYSLFDHSSSILKDSGFPQSGDCTCDQCYYVRGWSSGERVKDFSNQRKQKDALEPWKSYELIKRQGVEIQQVVNFMEQSDLLTQVLLSYIGYENKRIQMDDQRVLQDIVNKKKKRMDSDEESSSSSESDLSKLWNEDWDKINEETLIKQFRQLDDEDGGSDSDDDLFDEFFAENQNNEGIAFNYPFSPSQALVRFKLLKMKI